MPVDESPKTPIPVIDWAKIDIADIDPTYGYCVLPTELDDNEELYDDLA